jgi:hypothetical protein
MPSLLRLKMIRSRHLSGELFQLEALRHSNCSRPGLCSGTPCD